MKNDNEKVGKKVWLLEGDVFKGLHLTSKETYTVKEVKPSCKCKRINVPCEHYVLEKDGKTIEVEEYNCIFVPDESMEKSAQIETFLSENGVYPYEVSEDDKHVTVHIEWGDWKHDHAWCDTLMSYIGYEFEDEVETEEDGSDCYSSDHFYSKVE